MVNPINKENVGFPTTTVSYRLKNITSDGVKKMNFISLLKFYKTFSADNHMMPNIKNAQSRYALP